MSNATQYRVLTIIIIVVLSIPILYLIVEYVHPFLLDEQSREAVLALFTILGIIGAIILFFRKDYRESNNIKERKKIQEDEMLLSVLIANDPHHILEMAKYEGITFKYDAKLEILKDFFYIVDNLQFKNEDLNKIYQALFKPNYDTLKQSFDDEGFDIALKYASSTRSEFLEVAKLFLSSELSIIDSKRTS